MDPVNLTVSPLIFGLLLLAGAALLAYAWRKEKPKVETMTIDAARATAVESMIVIDKIVAAARADAALAQANLAASQAHADAARAALAGLVAPKV